MSEITGKVFKKYETFLMPESQIRENFTVPLNVRAFHVFQKASTAAHHLEKAAAAVVIFMVRRKVFLEAIDSASQKCHLDFWAGSIFGFPSILFDYFTFSNKIMFTVLIYLPTSI